MPEVFLTLAALAVLVVDLTVMRDAGRVYRRRIAAMVTGIGCVAASLWLLKAAPVGAIGEGILVADALTHVVKFFLVLLLAFAAVVAIDSDFTEHIGETYALLVLATLGFLFMASAEDLLMIFVALELASLSMYVLTGFRKGNLQSAEAALKYFLFGGMAAAFTLYGMSLVYGLSGSTSLRQIAASLQTAPLDPMLATAMVMVFIGFGFKVAAVPFHVWAPDAYQGAPTPAAAMIASGSKLASFYVLAKIAMVGLSGFQGSGGWHAFSPGWVPVLAVLAAFSMVLGNLVAIAQTNVKRLLAYSAVAHAGYALLGLLADNSAGVASLLYYVITYAFTVVGAFAVVGWVEDRTGDASLANFAGLSKRAPFLSLCLMIFVLSLAGIPPLAGFLGKFYVFVAAVSGKELRLLWLVVLAIAASAVSLYYYLQVLKQVYVAGAPEGAGEMKAPLSLRIATGVLALLVILLGCFPNLLLGPLQASVKAAGF
jgi:NADH-quinone oxidoreductase subunit N